MKKRSDREEVRQIRLDRIIPNRFQPRKAIDQASLQELMDSIKTAGVLEPIIVRPVPKQPAKYEIIMGERRFRACQALKKKTIPAVVKQADDRQMLEWALIENIQRKDLNPMERAKAYQQLAHTFGLTHKQVAERVGVDRATVTNFIRLLTLPPKIQADVGRQTIKLGHALALLAIPDLTRRLKIWQRVKREDLSVRHLRILVDAYLHPRGISIVRTARAPQYREFHPGNDPNLKESCQRVRERMGRNANVSVRYGKAGDKFLYGMISIGCNSQEEFQRLLKIIGSAQDK